MPHRQAGRAEPPSALTDQVWHATALTCGKGRPTIGSRTVEGGHEQVQVDAEVPVGATFDARGGSVSEMFDMFDEGVVVVTGGAGGLGRGVVPALLDAGARVCVPVMDINEIDGIPWSFSPDVTIVTGVDMRDEIAVTEFYASLEDTWASIHLVGGFSMAPLVDTSIADFKAMFEMNALTCFCATREAARAIARTGRGGRIVNVAARPALTPTGGMIAYSVSKAAVVAITESAAEELRSQSIFVNAVAPSIMDTPANRRAMPDADHGAWPSVDQVASAIVFLASQHNALTSGLIMPVYGRV